MKTLTKDRLREVLNYDPETGVFTWLIRPNRRIVSGRIAGTCRLGRVQIRIDSKIYLAHRLAWLYMHGAFPVGCIDHIDGDPLNNSLRNLRDVTTSINGQNRKGPQSNNTSGLLGVFSTPQGTWRAQLTTDRRSKHIGVFATREQAHSAYLEAKRVGHPGNTL